MHVFSLVVICGGKLHIHSFGFRVSSSGAKCQKTVMALEQWNTLFHTIATFTGGSWVCV